MKALQILIVEDEFVLANDFAERLQQWGYLTRIAFSGKEALIIFQKESIDLLLLDIHLGDGTMDGVEVAKAINRLQPVPIIFVTARLDDHTLQRAFQQNPMSYIAKPIREHDLRIAIKMSIANFVNQKSNTNLAQADDLHFLLRDNVFIKVNMMFKKIYIPDIKWVEANGSYINLETAQKSYRNLVNNLSKFNEQINHHLLLKVHRSWIVNIAKVDAINQRDRTLFVGEKEIPIGKTFYRGVMNYFQL